MSALEDRIRAGLNADRPVPDLWEGVQAGAGRRRARRTVATTAVVAAVVVAILAGVAKLSLLDKREAQLAPTPQPSNSQQLLDPDAWSGPTARFLDGARPKASELVGLWRIRTSDDAWLMLLGADGYWTTTNGWNLFGGGAVGNRGTWSLTQGRITVDGQEGFLGNGFREVLDVALMSDGSLHQVSRPAEGRCGAGVSCAPSVEPQRYLLDRVAPGDSLLLETLLSTTSTTVLPLPSSYLPGVWVTADGHWVLTINQDGRFRAFRDSGDPSDEPDDAGHMEVDPQGHLTMACQDGTVSAEVVLTRTAAVEGLLPPGIRMQSSSVDSQCPSGLGDTFEWIRVSQRA